MAGMLLSGERVKLAGEQAEASWGAAGASVCWNTPTHGNVCQSLLALVLDT